MLAGVATVDITPPVGTWLVGYLDREAVSVSIASPLSATALAIRDGEASLVLVSCELLALHPRLVAEVRNRVSAATGVAADAIWLIATHTHSGPPSEVTAQSNEAERTYAAGLAERIAAAAIAAVQGLELARLTFASEKSGAGENRRRIVDGLAVMEPAPGRPLDDTLSIVGAVTPDGQPIATFVTANCHPVTVGRDNLTVGGDYPGELCRRLDTMLGGTTLFAMGSAGDVNPRVGLIPDQSAAIETARLLADQVRGAMRSAAGTSGGVAVLRDLRDYPVAPSVVDRGKNAIPEIDHLIQLKGLDWSEIDVVMDRRHPWHPPIPGAYREQDRLPAEISVARLGDVALVALPFEVFSAVGLAIKRGSPFARTIVIGQTNGALGYLAPAEEHPFGGYEIREASLFYRTRGPLSGEATEQAIAVSLELLASLKEMQT